MSTSDLSSYEPDALLADLDLREPNFYSAGSSLPPAQPPSSPVSPPGSVPDSAELASLPSGAIFGLPVEAPPVVPASAPTALPLSPASAGGLPTSLPFASGFELPQQAEFQALLASLKSPAVTPAAAPAGLKAFTPSLPFAGTVPLPQESELQALLKPTTPAAPNSATGGVPASSATTQTSSFYFLDESRSPRRGESVSGIKSAHPAFDVHAVRRDFPILREQVNGRPLVWMDNAATTQKPQSVIDRIAYFYAHENSNIHRAAHELAARATDAYEDAREKVRGFINAPSIDDIVFVRGTTEAINLVAATYGRQNVLEGDEIIVTNLEHHANIVPWKRLCDEKGAKLRVVPVDDNGQVLLDEYQKLLNSRTKLVAFTHVSNALGTVTPARQMVEMAHRAGARVLIDGAQSVSHMREDVQFLDCDFFVFSGHKLFGPTGIGALYGKAELLDAMQPYQGGGNMIQDVTFERIIYQDAPSRFEAGTGNIADAVGLGAAIDYVQRIGIENIGHYEHQLVEYATHGLSKIPGLRIIGTAAEKASVVSFVLDGIPTEEIGAELNREGIAVRSGHHCAQPILRRFGLETTVRPSLAFYNTHAEIDLLVNTVARIRSGRGSRVAGV